MNKNSNKSKEQLIAELSELRKKSQKQEAELKAANQLLDAQNQQLRATEQQLRAANQQLDAEIQQLRATEKQLRATNQQLIASETKFKHLSLLKKAIIESPLGIEIFALDKNYRYLDFSLQHKQTMKAIWNVDIEIGGNMLDYIKYKTDREKAKKNFDRALQGEHFVVYEEYGDKNLKRTFYEYRYSPVYDENNNIIGVSVYVIDITERKSTEKALRESEMKFRNLAESTYMGIGLYQDDYWIYANPAAEKITGYSWNELKQMKFWEFVAPEYVDLIKERGKLRQKGKLAPSGYEFKIITKQGKEKWVYLAGNTTELKSGKAGLITVLDITERKQIEMKLRESEERFRKAFLTSPDSITISRLDNGRYVSVNDAFTKITGFSESDVIGKSSLEINIWVNAEDRKKFVEGLRKDGQVQNLEVQFRMKDGKIICGLLSASIIILDEVPHIISIARDITKRKRAEEELIKLSTAVTQSPSIIVITDTDGNIEYANPKFTEITAYRLEEVIGQNTSILKSGEQSEAYYRELLETISSGKVWRGEFHNKKKNGEFYWEMASISPIFDKKGKIINYIKISEDITEKKKTEQELIKAKEKAEENEKKYRNILNTLSEAVSLNEMIYNEQGEAVDYRIIDANESFYKMTGFTEESVINNTATKLYGLSSKYINEFWHYHITQKETIFTEMQAPGTDRYFLVSTSPIIDNKFVTATLDITELKKTEQELIKAKEKAEESEYKIRSMFENTQIGILYCNTEGKILEANQVLLDILGSPSKEATLKINLLTFKPLQDVGFSQNLKKCISEKIIITEDVVYTSKWGKTVFMKYYLIPVIINDKVIGVWANLNNLTDLWNIQTQLKKAKEKAEESDRLKSAFLANMSHEIRTPMNGILGFTQLLKKPNLTEDEKNEYIRIIEKSGNRLLSTINDIIDISRIETGQVKVTKTKTSVNQILEELYKFFLPEAKSKGIKLKYKSNLSDDEARIITDKQKLEGILTNLIKNAIKYTDEDEISIVCSIKKENHTEFIEFYVKDTGAGIPSNRLDAVFNRFEQADIADTKAYQGSGLGLAIVKSYVEMLGGKISVESQLGVGSTFTFSIPYLAQNHKETTTTQNNKKEADVSFKNLSIIIAEDEEINRLYYETILKDKFKKIIYTTNGKETVEKFREMPDTDIILMDIKMPDMNGYDATREIRKFDSNVIIIAQTAFGLKGDRQKAIDAGCDDYIVKPIKKDELFDKIISCMNNKKSSS